MPNASFASAQQFWNVNSFDTTNHRLLIEPSDLPLIARRACYILLISDIFIICNFCRVPNVGDTSWLAAVAVVVFLLKGLDESTASLHHLCFISLCLEITSN